MMTSKCKCDGSMEFKFASQSDCWCVIQNIPVRCVPYLTLSCATNLPKPPSEGKGSTARLSVYGFHPPTTLEPHIDTPQKLCLRSLCIHSIFSS
eukprot:39114-Amphidinium_carterae.1